MLKQILNELVMIKYELQALRKAIRKSEEFRGGVTISTYRPNLPQGHTEVSFSVSTHGWCQLEKTTQWEEFQKVLLEYQNKDSRMCR